MFIIETKRVHYLLPRRRIEIRQKKYPSYRKELREDFHGLCCYCGKSERLYSTRKRKFTIEHILPKEHFSHLEDTYSNLSFCCDHCNNKKGDHFVSEEEYQNGKFYVDAASVNGEYSNHLVRDKYFYIIPNSKAGDFMYEKLGFKNRKTNLTYILSLYKYLNHIIIKSDNKDEIFEEIAKKLKVDKSQFMELYLELDDLMYDEVDE